MRSRYQSKIWHQLFYFSNGQLDPWSGGGVLQTVSSSLIAIQIPYGAHHFDLRAANPGDTAYVIEARIQEKNILKNWIYGIPSFWLVTLTINTVFKDGETYQWVDVLIEANLIHSIIFLKICAKYLQYIP